MDEALAQVVVDLSGRPWCEFCAEFRREKIGELSTEMIEGFFRAFASACRANVQVRLLAGRNDHHKAEAIFKCFGLALRMACGIDRRRNGEIPSTKGVLE
jgi:imidazoleglycerol-phosphate dehydratase